MLKVYFHSIKYTIAAEQKNIFNFLLGVFSNFYSYLLVYVYIWILTYRFGAIGKWGYNDLIFLNALNFFTYSIAVSLFWKYIYEIEDNIKNGTFDMILVKPVNPILLITLYNFNWNSIGQIIVSLCFLFRGIQQSEIEWSFLKIFILLLSIIGGILIHCAAQIFFGSLNFWIKGSSSLTNILYYCIRNFINYPISIFGKYIRNLVTYIVPWAFINYYPAIYLLDKKDLNINYYIYTPIIGVGLFLISIYMTKIGIYRYKVNGG